MIHSTTILAVRHRDRAVMAGDGQVTFGQTVVKLRKVRGMTQPALAVKIGQRNWNAVKVSLFERGMVDPEEVLAALVRIFGPQETWDAQSGDRFDFWRVNRCGLRKTRCPAER